MLINRVWAGPAIFLFALTIRFHSTYRRLNKDEYMAKQNEMVNFEDLEEQEKEHKESGGSSGDSKEVVAGDTAKVAR